MFARRVALPRNLQTSIHYPTPYTFTASRPFSTTDLPNGIKLAYDFHEPPKAKEGSNGNAPPIIFIHGLFGSKQNNRSMSKYAPFLPDTPTRHTLTIKAEPSPAT